MENANYNTILVAYGRPDFTTGRSSAKCSENSQSIVSMDFDRMLRTMTGRCSGVYWNAEKRR